MRADYSLVAPSALKNGSREPPINSRRCRTRLCFVETEIHYPFGLYLFFTVANVGNFVFYVATTKNFVALLLKKGGNYSMKSIRLILGKPIVAVTGYLDMREIL